MLVMIDNFDSFTYNLYQYLMKLGAEVRVLRNNRLSVDELEAVDARGLVISRRPGRPADARQDVGCHRGRPHALPWHSEPLPGHALPLDRGGARHTAGLPRG